MIFLKKVFDKIVRHAMIPTSTTKQRKGKGMDNFDLAEMAHDAYVARCAGRPDEIDEDELENYIWRKTQKGAEFYPWSFTNMIDALAEMTEEYHAQIEESVKENPDHAAMLLRAWVRDYWEGVAERDF